MPRVFLSGFVNRFIEKFRRKYIIQIEGVDLEKLKITIGVWCLGALVMLIGCLITILTGDYLKLLSAGLAAFFLMFSIILKRYSELLKENQEFKQ